MTTPDDLQRGVMDGLADAAGEVGVDVAHLLRKTERMVHATTQSSIAGADRYATSVEDSRQTP